MKIAILEKDKNFREALTVSLQRETFPLDVDFFDDNSDFGQRAKLKEYAVIMVDSEAGEIDGYSILRALSTKTTAKLCLLLSADGNGKSHRESLSVFDDRISASFTKKNPRLLICWLKSLYAKQSLMDKLSIDVQDIIEDSSRFLEKVLCLEA